MFDLSIVEKGDVLLYKPQNENDIVGSLIAWLSNAGNYCHAAIYVGSIYWSGVQYQNAIIESHMDTGVVIKELNPKWYALIDVYRYIDDYGKVGLTDLQKDTLITYLLTKELGKGYDLPGFPSTFIKGVLAHAWGWKWFSSRPPIANDESHRFCSELVGAGYDKGLKVRLDDDLDPQSMSPSHLGRANHLIIRTKELIG